MAGRVLTTWVSRRASSCGARGPLCPRRPPLGRITELFQDFDTDDGLRISTALHRRGDLSPAPHGVHGPLQLRDQILTAGADQLYQRGAQVLGAAHTADWKCKVLLHPAPPRGARGALAPVPLGGFTTYERSRVLYRRGRAHRDLMIRNAGRDGALFGTFALRSRQRAKPSSRRW